MRFEKLSREYATLWDSMEIVRDESVMQRTAAKIIEFRAAYEEVESLTGVPWYVVGIMDMREGGGGAKTHLHNGDSLKAQTWQVPANRPPGKGPFTFSQSAVDCLVDVKGWNTIKDWSIERMAYVFETMNGFGYRRGPRNGKIRYAPMRSPYLWGGTNHQEPGKYIRDHVFSKSVEDKQHGCMPLLKVVADECGITLKSMFGATADPTEPSPATNVKADNPGMTTGEKAGAAAMGGTALGGAMMADPVGLTSTLVAVKGNAGQLLAGVDLALWSVPLVLGLALVAFIWWARKP